MNLMEVEFSWIFTFLTPGGGHQILYQESGPNPVKIEKRIRIHAKRPDPDQETSALDIFDLLYGEF